MKKILLLFAIIYGVNLNAQDRFKDAQIDFEIKNDSTDVVKTTDYLMEEKVFGNRREILNFSLIKDNGILYLHFQSVQANSEFLSTRCFENKSKIYIQLQNGKIVTLISTDNVCSQLIISPENQNQTRVLTNYFMFSKNNFEDLYTSPISMIRINYGAEHVDIVPKKSFVSEITKFEYFPESYFINNLKIFK